MQNITLTISLDEANLILEALGELSFKKVYPLVSKIQQQAAQQLNNKPPTKSLNAETNDG